uniref:CMRF35-like molecule 8 isoform X2 n=1 Tax=Scatophagus argus TaxID=75038 RepID=UPI001ED7EC3F|nr:CMRF35-like molecule 8 isoform X2 [Scatophagus argus]
MVFSMRISASRIVKMKISSLLLIISLLTESIGCQQPFIQTAYRTAKTTIKCDNPQYKHGNRSSVKFFCKENHSACEDILSALKSNRRFSLTETSSGFSMSISNVSSHDAGVYWCGVVQNEGRAALRKIQLKVERITNFTRPATSGQDFTYWCKYPDGSPVSKFICKGEDPSICEPLANTGNTHNNTRFVMKENNQKTNSTITVRNVRADDAGTYWCGAKNTDGKQSNPFYHRFNMTVVPAPTIPGSNSSTQSHPSPPISTENVELAHDSQFAITVIVCAAVLLLLFTSLIFIYKRCSHSENTGSEAAAQPIREDYIYEEIQEKVQKPDSGIAVSTIYSTANSPSDPSASLHYCTVKFKNSSEQTGDLHRSLSNQQSTSHSNSEESSAIYDIHQMYEQDFSCRHIVVHSLPISSVAPEVHVCGFE